MFISPAYAQTGGAPGGFGLVELFPFILIFVIMYFLIIRPQQKRAKEHREMLSKLRRGDEVLTQGGILGKITRVKESDEEVEVEIGYTGTERVRARVMKQTISMVISKTEPAGKAGGETKAVKRERELSSTKKDKDQSAANDDDTSSSDDK